MFKQSAQPALYATLPSVSVQLTQAVGEGTLLIMGAGFIVHPHPNMGGSWI